MSDTKDKLDEIERVIRDQSVTWDDESFRNGILLGLSLARSVIPTGQVPARDIPGPGFGVSHRKLGARYFRGPYSEIYRIDLAPTSGTKVVSRWNPLAKSWTRYGTKPAWYEVEKYTEI
jgi:hypothetical protein